MAAWQKPNPGEPAILAEQRRAMVENQIRKRGIDSPLVLEAMLEVPRHEFVPHELRTESYADKPVVIGEGQTISQPYIVAAMTAALELTGAERVLEVGAGCGYQSAILSLLAREIFSIEVYPTLAAAARERLARLGYANVRIEVADGTLGWPDAAPFDAILVAAAAPEIPPPLVEQLAEGGRLVIPVGRSEDQELRQLRKVQGRIIERTLTGCRFVPLVGRYGWPPNS